LRFCADAGIESLYCSARVGNFSYIFDQLEEGNYEVDLHFAEIMFTDGPPGMRVFDIFIQEKKVSVQYIMAQIFRCSLQSVTYYIYSAQNLWNLTHHMHSTKMPRLHGLTHTTLTFPHKRQLSKLSYLV
jgi:Malectin domain